MFVAPPFSPAHYGENIVSGKVAEELLGGRLGLVVVVVVVVVVISGYHPPLLSAGSARTAVTSHCVPVNCQASLGF